MSRTVHRIYIAVMVLLVIFTFCYLMYYGQSYYGTPLEERFYHDDHKALKASGSMGHGLGIVGTILIIIGVFWYMARKRIRALSRIGVLKYWLEFHIFLCTIGPIMILFHTSFKFGGIVSISFWSMVAVVASGVLGRFIYLQIPRTMQGRELSLQELREMRGGLITALTLDHGLGENILQEINPETNEKNVGLISQYLHDLNTLSNARSLLKSRGMNKTQIKSITNILSDELALSRKISRLSTMQKYFKYWHVAHLPFAIIMLVIMIVHVAVTLMFGYKWIF